MKYYEPKENNILGSPILILIKQGRKKYKLQLTKILMKKKHCLILEIKMKKNLI